MFESSEFPTTEDNWVVDLKKEGRSRPRKRKGRHKESRSSAESHLKPEEFNEKQKALYERIVHSPSLTAAEQQYLARVFWTGRFLRSDLPVWHRKAITLTARDLESIIRSDTFRISENVRVARKIVNSSKKFSKLTYEHDSRSKKIRDAAVRQTIDLLQIDDINKKTTLVNNFFGEEGLIDKAQLAIASKNDNISERITKIEETLPNLKRPNFRPHFVQGGAPGLKSQSKPFTKKFK